MVCSNVHPIWGKITSLTHLVFRWVETTKEVYFPLGLVGHLGIGNCPNWSWRCHGGAAWVRNNMWTRIRRSQKAWGFSMFSFGWWSPVCFEFATQNLGKWNNLTHVLETGWSYHLWLKGQCFHSLGSAWCGHPVRQSVSPRIVSFPKLATTEHSVSPAGWSTISLWPRLDYLAMLKLQRCLRDPAFRLETAFTGYYLLELGRVMAADLAQERGVKRRTLWIDVKTHKTLLATCGSAICALAGTPVIHRFICV